MIFVFIEGFKFMCPNFRISHVIKNFQVPGSFQDIWYQNLLKKTFQFCNYSFSFLFVLPICHKLLAIACTLSIVQTDNQKMSSDFFS